MKEGESVLTTLKNNKNTKVLDFPDRKAWRGWLEENHDSSSGVWLIVQKKNSRKIGVSLVDVVEEALCFGWIDSKLNVIDENHFKLLLTPRKKGSIWSKRNKQRVRRLIRQGLMTEAGLKVVEAAKKEGSWNRLDAVEELRLPEDLVKTLEVNKSAQKSFGAFSDSLKKQILW